MIKIEFSEQDLEKRNRVPALGMSFARPNLVKLISEIEALLLT